jgi:hypothetical protein
MDVIHIRVTAFTICSAFGVRRVGGVFLTSTTGGAQSTSARATSWCSRSLLPSTAGRRCSAAALPPSYQNIITGAVLLIAAGIDALSRRRSATRRS